MLLTDTCFMFFFLKNTCSMLLLTIYFNRYMIYFAGITSDTKQYEQVEINGKLDRLEEQNSVKQSLISAYKKNLYPPLKEEFSRAFPQDQTVNMSRSKTRLTSKVINVL